LGRVESRFRDFATELCDGVDPYTEKPLISVETKEREDGEKAISLWAFDDYVLEIGVHERRRGDSNDTRRGFHAYTNINGEFTRHFAELIGDLQGIAVQGDEPVFVFYPRQGERYVLTPEEVFAAFLDNVRVKVRQDIRIYNVD
jgi:hypothetical protein